MVLRIPLVFAIALSVSTAAHAGSFRSAKSTAVKALKRASKDIRSRTTCQQSQGDNVRDALRRTKAITQRTSPGEPEELKLFLAGVALAAVFSGCLRRGVAGVGSSQTESPRPPRSASARSS